ERCQQRNVLRWIELDQRQGVLQVGKLPLRRDIGTSKTQAAPLGNRMQRRVLQELRAAPFDPRVRCVAQSSMEFLDQSRLTQTRLADDHHQLAVALLRPLPATHQHRDFFLTANERREMALACPASAPARPYKLEQRYRLGHAFEFMDAALCR